jgi:hypothetical protein
VAGAGPEPAQELTIDIDATISIAHSEKENARFPWKPSATMLNYRFKDTTGCSGSTATNPHSIHPTGGAVNSQRAESSQTPVRLEDGAA